MDRRSFLFFPAIFTHLGFFLRPIVERAISHARVEIEVLPGKRKDIRLDLGALGQYRADSITIDWLHEGRSLPLLPADDSGHSSGHMHVSAVAPSPPADVV